jgi:hypothetical protein
VTRAKRETLFTWVKGKEQSKIKIKSTPPQSSPALRAREEAEAEQEQDGSQLALG